MWEGLSGEEPGVDLEVPAKAHWRMSGEFCSRFWEDSAWCRDLMMRISMKWEPCDVRTIVEVGSEGSFGGYENYLAASAVWEDGD